MKELDLLKSLFDYIRIIDPLKKEIKYGFGPEEFHVITHEKCYDYWNKDKVCDNCISVRAVSEKKTLVKFEMVGGRGYLVMSAPYEIDGELRVIELIKDISDNNIIEAVEKREGTDYSDLIATLNQAVVSDDLTGLYNKRYVEEHLPYDLKKNMLSNKWFFIGMADIDHFKKVNDTFGHVIGDKVLRRIGAILKSNVRSDEDWIARYGGEEFMIVIKGGDEAKFKMICERIRKEIETTQMIFDGHEFGITISIGGIGFFPSDDNEMESLISRADKNLYKAKANGRNQCIVEMISP